LGHTHARTRAQRAHIAMARVPTEALARAAKSCIGGEVDSDDDELSDIERGGEVVELVEDEVNSSNGWLSIDKSGDQALKAPLQLCTAFTPCALSPRKKALGYPNSRSKY